MYSLQWHGSFFAHSFPRKNSHQNYALFWAYQYGPYTNFTSNLSSFSVWPSLNVSKRPFFLPKWCLSLGLFDDATANEWQSLHMFQWDDFQKKALTKLSDPEIVLFVFCAEKCACEEWKLQKMCHSHQMGARWCMENMLILGANEHKLDVKLVWAIAKSSKSPFIWRVFFYGLDRWCHDTARRDTKIVLDLINFSKVYLKCSQTAMLRRSNALRNAKLEFFFRRQGGSLKSTTLSYKFK